MEIPLNIANQIKPGLDAAAHSHIFSETQETADPVVLFSLPLNAKELPLIAWTQVKVRWQNAEMDHAYVRITLTNDGGTVLLSPPFVVKQNCWAPLEWLLPSIPLDNGRLGLQVELDPLYANGYVNLRVVGFDELLDRIPNYIFVNDTGAMKWLLVNCDNAAWIEEYTDFQGEEDSFLYLKPLVAA